MNITSCKTVVKWMFVWNSSRCLCSDLWLSASTSSPLIYGMFNPLEPRVPLSSLVLKEYASVVKSVRNLDVKCEIQMCACTFCS